MRYVRNECEGLDPLLESSGLRAIAEDGGLGQIFEVNHGSCDLQDSLVDVYQILTVLLMAAVMGPEQDRERHVMTITKLDGSVQGEIAKIIQLKQQELQSATTGPPNDGPEEGAPPANDYELDFEARYSELIARKKNVEQDLERINKRNADLTTRIERLQDHNDLLQEQLTAAKDELSSISRDRDAAEVIKGYEAKIREQDELIANQEGQLEQDRIERTNMRKEIDRLQSISDMVVRFEDENKELRYQNAELTKKSNTLDRYKQKLESQRDFQTDLKTLELDNEELRLRLKDFEAVKIRNESLEATHKQFQNTIGKLEEEIFELSRLKKTVNEEKADLLREIRRIEEMRAADEKHIEELQEQLVDRPQSVVSPVGLSMASLEDELEETQAGTRTSLEVSRLRAENQLLKGNATAAQDAAALRIQLEEEERLRKREQAKYNELYEKHVIASQQVTAILEASTAEGLVKGINAAMLIGRLDLLTPEYYSTEAFADLRKSYFNTAEKLRITENRTRELEAELEQTKRELLRLNTDCKCISLGVFKASLTSSIVSMIEHDEIEALEELKATQQALASSTEMELKKLQSRYKDLQADNEQQKSQLIEALLSKDKLQQEINENRTKDVAKADVPVEKQQMNDILDKTSSELKASQEVSEELAREQALFCNDLAAPCVSSIALTLPMSATYLRGKGNGAPIRPPRPISCLKPSSTYVDDGAPSSLRSFVENPRPKSATLQGFGKMPPPSLRSKSSGHSFSILWKIRRKGNETDK